jgi:hypothetical protein
LKDLLWGTAEIQEQTLFMKLFAGGVAFGYAEAAVEGTAGDEVNGDESADQFDWVVFWEEVLIFLHIVASRHSQSSVLQVNRL